MSSRSSMDEMDEIRSQVSAASQKLIEMGFSEEAADAAAKESLARRMERRGIGEGGRRGRGDFDGKDDVDEGEEAGGEQNLHGGDLRDPISRSNVEGVRLPRIGRK